MHMTNTNYPCRTLPSHHLELSKQAVVCKSHYALVKACSHKHSTTHMYTEKTKKKHTHTRYDEKKQTIYAEKRQQLRTALPPNVLHAAGALRRWCPERKMRWSGAGCQVRHLNSG